MYQRDIAAPVHLQRLNQNSIDLAALAMIVRPKDIQERNAPTRNKANMTRFHQIPVLSHVKVQKHPEHTGRDHALQLTMVTPQSSEREITVYTMLRTDHQNHQTTVILDEDSDHHHQIIGGDIPGVHQVHLEAAPIDGKVDTHLFDIAKNSPVVREEATGRQAPGGVIARLV